MRRQQVFQLVEAVEFAYGIRGAEGAAVTVGRFGLDRGEKKLPVNGVEEVDPPHTDRPQGIAMVGIGKGDKPRLAGIASRGLLLILKGHLQGDLYGGGPAFGVKDAGQSPGNDLQQLFRAFDGRLMGQAEKGRMGDPIHLLLDGPVNLFLAMTVDIGPEGRNPVDVIPSVHVPEEGPLPFGDDQHVLRRELLHLRKGKPDGSQPVVNELSFFFFLSVHCPLFFNL
ncbi:MAG: hypothetical protein A4E72_01141 [Syntrophus sp. PtaU1.Bin208]|nr:MAG: hypothetical protein A4E72_01141 [Syntrophus sp. PtaU1.Bin208]